ncbi:SDR family NAD(P)-dependent oxidoreductase [Mariniphaga sediminis]|jgi:short-subunit dehydrogenase|uniref:SDR family NAD(P)-dependent oxidoreductase n=1 Tax=Mariniphaga sediminis TaxID=1628158 RepID=A0A399CY56_9BACT|nr:SDR family NAD(P)-dependent oxidoreductase [Mariniphaga sediminis]RIH64685.1 SDR family NAD(P)-dependent oxidoreductase [Mariniphaga sediminis]
MKTEQYTLITGASTGLGKELATECARLGKNLVLAALPGEQIARLGLGLSLRFGVKVKTFETDLTQWGAVEDFVKKIIELEIEILINNAGLGGTKPFLEATPEYIDRIILLNMRALVLLTRLLLPALKRQKKAYILNISSMASFGPMPFKTIYPASKAFVYSFSRGLGAELKGSGIVVSVAHPGGMKTNAEVTRRIERHNRLIRSTTLSAAKVAKICIRQLLKNDELIIPGLMNKLSWLTLKIVPVWLRLIILRSALQNEMKESM